MAICDQNFVIVTLRVRNVFRGRSTYMRGRSTYIFSKRYCRTWLRSHFRALPAYIKRGCAAPLQVDHRPARMQAPAARTRTASPPCRRPRPHGPRPSRQRQRPRNTKVGCGGSAAGSASSRSVRAWVWGARMRGDGRSDGRSVEKWRRCAVSRHGRPSSIVSSGSFFLLRN